MRNGRMRGYSLPVLAVGLLVVVAGCAHVAFPPSAPGRLHCPADQIKVTVINDHTKRIDGCGHSATYLVQKATSLWAARWMSVDDLKQRASFDLSCPVAQLTIRQLGGIFQQGVSGCGHRAVYTYVQTSYRSSSWVMDSADGQPRKRKHK